MTNKINKYSALFMIFLAISIFPTHGRAFSMSYGKLGDEININAELNSGAHVEITYSDNEFTPAVDYYNSLRALASSNSVNNNQVINNQVSNNQVSNNSVSIMFNLEKAGFVNIKIYDETGKVIDELARSSFGSGSHELTWNASKFPKGNYYCSVITEEYSQTKKLK